MKNELSSDTCQLHTCSYYCHHSACIKAQRDYLRDRVLELEAALADLDPHDKHKNLIGLI